MSFFENIKSSFTTTPPPEEGTNFSIATNPTTPILDDQPISTWTTFVESMDNARRRASVIFTPAPPDEPPLVALTVSSSIVKTWWDEAASFLEETKLSMEEKLADLAGPSEIKNDPLRKLRESLGLYSDTLEQLKLEAFNFALSAETLGRVGSSSGLEMAIQECCNIQIFDQYGMYGDKHTHLVRPILTEVKEGVEDITAIISEEVLKIHSLLTRFKRRDKIHKSVLDHRARVELKRDKNNKRSAEGLPVDLEEVYALSRQMDTVESDFRVNSEQLVQKCNDVLGNRSKTVQRILTQLVDIQNTYMYRIGNSCSIPFQELFEHLKTHTVNEDMMEDLGPHPLTWRSRENSDEEGRDEVRPLKKEVNPIVVLPKRIGQEGQVGVYNVPGMDSPNSGQRRYSYSRQKGSPRRRGSVLDESVDS